MAEPNGELLTRVADLIEASGRVEAEITADRAAREAEKAALEQRMATNVKATETAKRTARVAVVVGIVGVLAGISGLVYGRDAQATADDILASRKDARAVVCKADNDDAAKQHSLWEGLLALPRAEGSAPPNEATLAAFRKILDDTFPTRDCSPAAIAAYYGGSK